MDVGHRVPTTSKVDGNRESARNGIAKRKCWSSNVLTNRGSGGCRLLCFPSSQSRLKVAAVALTCAASVAALAQTSSQKPNIVLLVSDDTGWGDLGVYGGGEGSGAPTY